MHPDARIAPTCQVGGNYGWYTLWSLALGCSVVVFEPVPRYLEVMKLGLSLNPGFANRVTIFANVVYDEPGEYSLRVPNVNPHLVRPLSIGMTGMDGRAGVLKTIWSAKASVAKAKAVRLDDIVQREDICILKADVEGYEPQVLQTAAALLSRLSVAALQFELTHTDNADQTCASINMLEQLLGPLDFELRQIMPASLHSSLPSVRGRRHPREWKTAPPSAWDTLRPFPSKPPCASSPRPCSWQTASLGISGRLQRLQHELVWGAIGVRLQRSRYGIYGAIFYHVVSGVFPSQSMYIVPYPGSYPLR